MITDIREQARGKWASILTNIGIDEIHFTKKEKPCMYCGGNTRAWWWLEKEVYSCSHCGHHHPINIAMSHLALDFKNTVFHIRKILSGCTTEPVKEKDPARDKERLEKIHSGLKKITQDSPLKKYFLSRGISVLPQQDCYFLPGCDYYQEGKSIGKYPAIVAAFRTLNGELSTYHITYLNEEFTKLQVESPRKILPTIRPLPGCAIRLFKEEEEICVAEGIESALSVHELTEIPVWAAGNSSQMAAMQIPDSVKKIWIYVDNDRSFDGQQSGYTLAKRMTNKGKIVRVVNLINKNIVEDYGEDYDFNNYLNEVTK